MAVDKQLIINLAAKMDSRSNNEFMETAPNDVGLQLVSLTNQDLFYSKSLTSRQGTLDVSGGIINAVGTPVIIYNLVSGTAGGTKYTKEPVFLADKSPERQGMIINFGTGSNFNITNGTVYLQDCFQNPALAQEIGYDINIQVYLSQINTELNAQPGSGVAFIDDGGYHSLALSGNFNTPFFQQYPQLLNATNVNQNYDTTPAAISEITTVNFGNVYTNGSGTAALPYGSPILEVPFELSAPYPFQPNTPYYISITANNTSGTSARNIQAMVMSDGVDNVPNALYGNEFYSFTPSGNFSSIIRNYSNNNLPSGSKAWLQSTIYQEVKPSDILLENTGVNFTLTAPIENAQLGYLPSPNNVTYQNAPTNSPFYSFNPNITTLKVSTTGTPFGQIFTIPSGIHSINGGYIYANTFTGNNYKFFGINKLPVDTSNYSVDYVTNLFLITGTNGGVGLNFNTKLLTSYTGNYTFNNPNVYQDATHDTAVSGINSNLEKVYSLFQNPVTINTTGNISVLLAWQFFDQSTGLPVSDYGARDARSGGQLKIEFCSPISVGMYNPQSTGTTDTFTYYNKNINAWDVWDGYSTKKLSSGLLSIPSGNAITSIYDYRVGDNSSQRVMYTQGPDLGYFTLDAPTSHTIIYSSGVTDDQAKWSHSTFQNELFSHQYSEKSGICWDQIYSQPTGNWTQLHGLRPSFSGNSASIPQTPHGTTISGSLYTTGIPTGSNFNVVLATSILTGGLRASELISFSGTTGNTINIFGTQGQSEGTYPFDIFHVSGLSASGITTSGQSQYKFDVFSNGTYVFATQSTTVTSGQNFTYFLAPLCDSSGNAYPNPMPNNNTWNAYAPFYSGNGNVGSGVYIYDITFQGVNAQQVPQIINYAQTYLLNQVSTPKFKKTIVWNNIMWGIGDPENPSRLWYGQNGAPQIWGGAGDDNYGYYDIDVDNGQYITGIEIFKNFMIIFKQNSTYSAQYTFTAGNPLNIQQISPTKGNLSIFSTAATDYGVFGLSQYGPVLATYYGTETIGDEILNDFQTLSHNDLIHSVVINDVAHQQLLWSITNSSISPDNQTGIVYSYAEKGWGFRKNGLWNSAGTIGNTDDFALLYIGDTYGQIKQINSGTYGEDILYVDTNGVNLSENINLSFETPWLNFGNSNDMKQYTLS